MDRSLETPCFVIQVKDSGIGITPEKLKHIESVLEHDELGTSVEMKDHAEGFMLGLRASNKMLNFMN